MSLITITFAGPSGSIVTVSVGRLSPLKSGNLTADGTEQTLLEFVDVGRISGYVDLVNMENGDSIIIRQYIRVVEGGPYRKYAQAAYGGVQSDPMLYFVPKETDFGIKITLQQTSGGFRVFPNNFLKES